MSDDNKKQFATTLRSYKAESIRWDEVFQRFRPIFVPHKADLFIGLLEFKFLFQQKNTINFPACSNVLRSEDKMKYLKKALESKIHT